MIPSSLSEVAKEGGRPFCATSRAPTWAVQDEAGRQKGRSVHPARRRQANGLHGGGKTDCLPRIFLSLTRRVQVEPGKTNSIASMAWRPNVNLINGVLDNRTPGSVRGCMRFHRRGRTPLRVVLELAGDFYEDMRGKVIRLSNPYLSEKNEHLEREGTYMEGFAPVQQGEAGDITLGVPLGLGDKGETRFVYTP